MFVKKKLFIFIFICIFTTIVDYFELLRAKQIIYDKITRAFLLAQINSRNFVFTKPVSKTTCDIKTQVSWVFGTES